MIKKYEQFIKESESEDEEDSIYTSSDLKVTDDDIRGRMIRDLYNRTSYDKDSLNYMSDYELRDLYWQFIGSPSWTNF